MSEELKEVDSSSVSSDEKTWAVLVHLSSFVAGFIVPLIVWLLKRDEWPFVGDQAKEALNFNLSVMIYSIALLVATLTVILAPLTFLAFPALMIFFVVMVIMAAIKSSEGKKFRYPLCLRLIK